MRQTWWTTRTMWTRQTRQNRWSRRTRWIIWTRWNFQFHYPISNFKVPFQISISNSRLLQYPISYFKYQFPFSIFNSYFQLKFPISNFKFQIQISNIQFKFPNVTFSTKFRGLNLVGWTSMWTVLEAPCSVAFCSPWSCFEPERCEIRTSLRAKSDWIQFESKVRCERP